jgi:hypothetical protein
VQIDVGNPKEVIIKAQIIRIEEIFKECYKWKLTS